MFHELSDGFAGGSIPEPGSAILESGEDTVSITIEDRPPY